MYVRILVLVAMVFLLVWILPAQATTSHVIINELLWMGSPASAQDEWIELLNTTDSDIDLSGWRITKLSNDVETEMLVLPGKTIPAHGFFLIANYANGDANSALMVEPDVVDPAVSLVNSKLLLHLYDAGGAVVDVADEGIGIPFAGEYASGSNWASMERHRVDLPGDTAEAWHTASANADVEGFFATPKVENSNQAPDVACVGPDEVIVGTSATFTAEATDADNDVLAISWSVDGSASGTGATFVRTFAREGEFLLSCTVSDGRASATQTLQVFVQNNAPVTQDDGETPSGETPPDNTNSNTNTSPSDKTPKDSAPQSQNQEPMTSAHVLLTAVLPNPPGDDTAGEYVEITNFAAKTVDLYGWSVSDGSRTFTLAASTPLKSGATLRIMRTESRIMLNNTGDVVHLIDPFGKKVNGVEFGTAPEDQIFLRDGASTHWQWSGEENEESEKIDAETEDAAITPETDGFASRRIADLASLDRNEKVAVSGVVIALPGQIASHTLYIAEGDALVRVYSSTDRFPELALDDVVTVRGVIGMDQSGVKVNLGRDGGVEVSDAVASESVVETVSGTVEKKQRTLMTLATDAGPIAVRVKSGTGIDLASLLVGDGITVTGFFLDDEFLPRSIDDIVEQKGAVLAATDEASPAETAPVAATTTELHAEEPFTIKPTTMLALVLSALMLAIGGVFFVLHRRGARNISA
ncbi:MAG: lamin tail domain-containing protein [Patescibacteria group bacterium]|jgi:hypothetical protein